MLSSNLQEMLKVLRVNLFLFARTAIPILLSKVSIGKDLMSLPPTRNAFYPIYTSRTFHPFTRNSLILGEPSSSLMLKPCFSLSGLSIMGCDSCMHPTCKHSLTRNGVCPCPGESGAACPGTLVLDVNSYPNWKMACNRCNNLVLFKVTVRGLFV